ncbi:MAG: DegT/DnrJ/EryC1/StrS aminotransferase family protein, partial [Betaproteobacteria bacterium]
MRSEFLPFSPPWVGQEEIDEVADTLRSGWLSTGPKTRQFEQQFAALVNAPGALALNSCTAGLHTALVALGIGPGDEVITTPITFAATVNVIEHVGARPVLADVEPDTLNIAPHRVEAALTRRTKAIIPVHFAGHPVDMEAVTALAEPRGIAIIEDAAHALGAKYRGRWIGDTNHPVAYSFY